MSGIDIAVVGLGYVGLSLAVALAAPGAQAGTERHRVRGLDIDADRVAMVNAGQSPIADPDLSATLAAGAGDLRATTDPAKAYAGVAVVIVATPTDYDHRSGGFDTASVEAVIAEATARAPGAPVVIKSTVPVGFTDRMRARFGRDDIVMSPEFLREGQALADTRAPSRIVVGGPAAVAEPVAALLAGAATAEVPVLLTTPAEAEAIKLFSNTYLAMRVAFFNELDSYALGHGLETRRVIDGVCADPRIGTGYNNPSFGYGGYCLPKDTRQLLAHFGDRPENLVVPQNLMRAIVEANETRKAVIAAEAEARLAAQHAAGATGPVGIYRLTMKAGADSIRDSSVLGVVQHLVARGVPVLVHEPLWRETTVEGAPVEPDLARFKARCALILANRQAPALEDVAGKVFSRDLFGTA
jgi:UDPglucose 6-dehydrogenase